MPYHPEHDDDGPGPGFFAGCLLAVVCTLVFFWLPIALWLAGVL
jgi:hypothetical protein